MTPFVPRLVRTWLADDPQARHRTVEGSLAFVDISGFTELTERLAAQGKIGAEELTDILDRLFTELLEVARSDGAQLVKWGGDAVLLLFDAADTGDHPARAARAAFRMRARLQRFARVRTPGGTVHLQMSAGIHSGQLSFFLVGDPTVHRELIVCGPAATRTAQVEAAAQPGEIGLSSETAALLPPTCVDTSGSLALLTAEPPLDDLDAVAAAAAAAAQPDLTHALPPPVRAYLLETDPSAEHRKAAVAFVRFSGSDGLLAEAGPDQLAVALDECVRVVQSATARHGVTFLESDIDQDGGKIMLVSGAPRSAGQDEDRLLRAALHIVSASTMLSVQIGVSRGAVFTGVLGPDFCRTYSVKGDAVNLAARLAAQAQPGQALCTLDTLSHTQSRYLNEPLAPLRLKGKSAPVEAAVLGPEVDEPIDTANGPAADPGGAALVGRDVELSVLRSALHEAVGGAGTLVEIVGEPGIGKSRLLAALLSETDIQTISISCDEYETGTPYRPLRSLFGPVLGIAGGTHEPGGLRAAVCSIDPTLEPWLPLIGRMLDVEVEATPEVDALSDQFRQTRLREVAAQLLTAALPEPVVLAFEDVHLMDDASAGVLARIVHEIHSRPWLVVVTRREVPQGFRPSGTAVVSVRPAPLDQGAAAELARLVGATDLLPATVIDTLAARAGGNPLFLRGLVRAVVDGANADTLPDTVEALITSELDRLPTAERTMLRYASVLGMRFDRAQLAALIGERDLPTTPDALRRLVYFVRAEGESLGFAHQLVRDTAYETLPFRLRSSLHGAAGDLLESSEPEPDDIAEVLSLHFAQADRPAKVWHYARIGGERAAAKFAYVQAEELYARAVHAARHLPGVPAGDLVDANVSLADARFRIGHQREALDAYRDARQSISGDPVRAALLLRSEALVEYRSGRHSVGLGKLTKGMHLLDGGTGSGSDTGSAETAATLAARSRLQESYAVIRQAQGRYRDALRWARRADHDAEESQDPGARAEALQAVLSALAMLGDDIPIALAEEAIWLYRRVGDRAGQSRALNNLAMLRWLDGKGPQALATFGEAEQLATDAGDTVKAAVARYNIGDVLLRIGRLDEARELLSGLLPVLRAVGLEDYAATATRALGAAIALSGRIDDGTALLHRARAWLEELGEPAEALETDAALAWTMLEHGDCAGAAELAERAARQADELDAGQLLPWLLRLQGAALSDLGRLDDAHQLLQRALDLAKTRSRVERGFVLAELSTVAHRRGTDAAAAELADRAEAAFDELGFSGSRRYPRPAS